VVRALAWRKNDVLHLRTRDDNLLKNRNSPIRGDVGTVAARLFASKT